MNKQTSKIAQSSKKANVRPDESQAKRGRPKIDAPKISITIRLDADILAQFKAMGPKWQTRINDALREWLKQAG